MKRFETELGRDDTGCAFVARTDHAPFELALRELAYAAEDGEFVRHAPCDAPDLTATYERFGRHAEELLEQTARDRA